MRRTLLFSFFLIFKTTVLIIFFLFKLVLGNKIMCILQYLLGCLFPKKNEFFQIIFLGLCSIEFENFPKTLLFEFLNFSKTLLFSSFIIFKRTQGTSIPLNYIYFIKNTNEWIVWEIIRPFGY